jgi:ubiquinone/menaquinone biosynthesis C-methylase UbiE
MTKRLIVEKRLGISADYQYKALRSGLWLQKQWHRNKFKALEEVIAGNKEGVVLDLGTGSGNFEILFNRQLSSIVGVDYNDEALSFLKKYLKERDVKNVKLVQSDIRKLPKMVTSKKYDLIVSIDTIEHIKIGEAKKLIRQTRKMLKKGGELVVVTPNYKGLWSLLETVMDKLKVVPQFDGEQHLSKFNKKSLEKTFEDAGYSSIESFSFNLLSFLSPFKWLNDRLLRMESKMLGDQGCLIFVSGKN